MVDFFVLVLFIDHIDPLLPFWSLFRRDFSKKAKMDRCDQQHASKKAGGPENTPEGTMKHAFVWAILALISFLLPASVVAQPGAGPNPAAIDKYYDCKAQFESKEYAKALECFDAAYKLDPNPTLRWNIARCYEQIGDLPMALGRFEAYKASVTDPKDIASAQAKIESIKLKIAAKIAANQPTTAAPTTGDLTIGGPVPSDAIVTVGEKTLGEMKASIGQPFKMAPGTYAVRVVDKATVISTGEVKVEAGKATTWTYVAVSVQAPPVKIVLPEETPTSDKWTPRKWGWILSFSAAGLGAASTTVFGLKTLADQDAAAGMKNNPGKTREQFNLAVDDMKTSRLITNISIGFTMAAAGTGLYLFLTDNSNPQKTRKPTVEASPAGVTIHF